MSEKEHKYEQLISECQKLRQELQKCRNSSFYIEESTSNLNALINNQEASIWSIDADYRYVILNDYFKNSYKEAFGIELEIGYKSLEILSPELKAFWKEKYDEALKGKQITFEFTNYTDDVLHYYNVSLNPVISNNIIIGVAALSVDVTEQKVIEQHLSESHSNMLAIMENTLESIWAINTKYEILFTNSVFQNEFYRSFGVKLEKGVNILDSLPEPLKPIWKPRYDRALNNERFSFVDEIDVGDKIFYVEVSMNPIISNNEVVGASFFANDISRRMNAQAALKENEQRLNELNITKDKFFSIIAHDLKSPFNSILGLSDLLVAEVEKGNNIHSIASIIQKSSHQVTNLINNLLEWSRSQSGKMDFNPEYFKLSTIIKEELNALEVFSSRKNIVITNNIDEKIIIYADKYMISSVLRNLISNAIKFTDIEGRITLSHQKNDNNIVCSVADTGVGIHHNDIPKLFMLDQNHTTAGTQHEQGTGLGLILCKEFIEKHGGEIWVNSAKGKGSEFSFLLPLAPNS